MREPAKRIHHGGNLPGCSSDLLVSTGVTGADPKGAVAVHIRTLAAAVSAMALCLTTAIPAVAQPNSRALELLFHQRQDTVEAQDEPREGEIDRRYAELSPEMRAAVGGPVAPEVVEGSELRYRDFSHARFYWTPETEV